MKETQRVIKFRTFNPRYNEFNYWGFIGDYFTGPPTGSGLTIEECSQSDRFSGLQDSKGVDIYEGDVIKWNHYKHFSSVRGMISKGSGYVYWSEDVCWRVNMQQLGIRELLVNAYHSAEVIGHIYDPKFSHLL